MVLASAVTGTVTAAPAATGAAASLNGKFIFMKSHFCKALRCKCLQGFTKFLRGNQSAGISNLWGLHAYLQSL